MRPQDYEAYCRVDPVFYDDPGRSEESRDPQDPRDLFEAARGSVPDGWLRSRDGVWVYLHPDGVELPDQGWKIHVSGTFGEAEEVIGEVLAYCREHRLSVKFLRGPVTVLAANSKYAPRASSGKLLTLYPRDEAELRRALTGLAARLDGRRGPYILSDLRWRDTVLYVRYGAFRQMYCVNAAGETVSALRDPAGALVPDLRRPVFSVPDWVTVPGFLAEQVAARAQGRPEDFPYDIERALHFSNGGGVYKARDRRDGRGVVLREARPLAGLDDRGTDAVTRLHRERDMLRRLAGLDFVPRLYDHVTVWEHEYLVEEFIEGEKLERHLFNGAHPLLSADPDQETLDAYVRTALDFSDQLASMIQELHRRGVVFGDLHPGNVMVRPDGRLALVDFELAFDAESGSACGLGAPGFVCATAREGTSVDDYALACMRLFFFLPLTFLIELDSRKAQQLARAAAERFGLGTGFADALVHDLRQAAGGTLPPGRIERPAAPPTAARTPAHGARGTTGGDGAEDTEDTESREDTEDTWEPGRLTGPEELRQVMDSLAAGIVAAATPERTDRLFPGDPEQFHRPAGPDVAHGAAGVLYALATAGYPVPAEHVAWLVRATEAPGATRAGLYDGLYGAAVVLDRLGEADAARRALARAGQVAGERAGRGILTTDLSGGTAGAGLALLHFGLVDEAADLGGSLAERLGAAGRPPGRRPGLLYGASGAALFLVRLHEHTGEDRWLDLAGAALAEDLTHASVDTKGMLFRNGGHLTPYLANGSAGVALAARALLRHRDDAGLRRAVGHMERACAAEFTLMPGLFEGRAGLICSLAAAPAPRSGAAAGTGTGTGPDGSPAAAARAQALRLDWHLLRHGGHAAVPGQHLFRLSADLATGAAGVLLALRAALDGTGTALPLLDPFPAEAARR
ncbi:class III lanthionine synthetase LanKC [Streptomyces andamanensis]|uniref:Class III lanthionine synthetase LanKC n=1 Tax=Streptomyces andamanensis TaxID=1565035 RepID=A0ABV8T7C4_9ACTN